MKPNLGYCCINLSLRSDNIMVNRNCRKKTFQEKGLSYVNELAIKNVTDLIEIIKWNYQNGYTVYRMSSNMIPWMSEYELIDLPKYKQLKKLLKGAGTLTKKYKQRLSLHPGPFNVLGSPNPDLVTKTQKELRQHGEIMDMMGLEQSRKYPINIHCNGVYGDKIKTLNRWCSNYLNLTKSAKNRLVVENDDKASMYSVQDLYDIIFSKIKVPITFDYHHHRFNNGDLTEKQAFLLAKSTWDYYNIKPLFHYSSCRKTFEDPDCKAQAHADYVYEKINTYNSDVDIEMEAKSKNLAVEKYKKETQELLESYKPI